MPSTRTFDYLLVGGGLQNALIALALLQRRPDASICLIEKDGALAGSHTWSFHPDDVPSSSMSYVGPLVEYEWPDYEVRFPGLTRRLGHRYRTVTSSRVDRWLQRSFASAPHCELRLGASAEEIGPDTVRLSSGETLAGQMIIDARGPERHASGPAFGYQKFVGLEIRLDSPAGPQRPIVMDGTVEQVDGFRFMYVLPLEPDRLLLEDTYYSDSPLLERERIRERIERYLEQSGWARPGRWQVEREEHGVLPIPLKIMGPPQAKKPLLGGYAGGWFHPTTAYSFPTAVRLAEHVSTRPVDVLFDQEWEALVSQLRSQGAYCVWLNRLLFLGVEPAQRWRVLARFYRLPEATIRRFYALQLTPADRSRILIGRLPEGVSLRGLWNVARSLTEPWYASAR
ncbi:MAG: lycopene beta-cyclase CrtY [Myxococcaceae bacterium]